MSYKCLHDDLEGSDKHAALSDFASRIWMLALAKSDCRGRLLADPEWLAAHLGFKSFDPARVAEALDELHRVGLVHRYEVGGKRYLVFHKAHRSCAYTGQGKAKPRYPAPPAALCECCIDSFQQSDSSASGSASACAISSPPLSPAVDVVVLERGAGRTKTPPPYSEPGGSPETHEVAPTPPGPLSANREALHLAQRWRGANGRASTALSSFEKATHAFEITLAAGADAHAIEAAIIANPGRSPLEIRDIVLPRVARTRAAPPQESVEESTRRMEAMLNNPQALRRATT